MRLPRRMRLAMTVIGRRQLSPILPSPFGHLPQRGRLSEEELEIGRAKSKEELEIPPQALRRQLSQGESQE